MSQIIIVENEQMETITINGITQNIKHKISSLVCPKCNTPFQEYKESRLNLIKLFSQPENQVIKYCVLCGEKLEYPTIINGVAREI